jgi:hypothetical protein
MPRSVGLFEMDFAINIQSGSFYRLGYVVSVNMPSRTDRIEQKKRPLSEPFHI